jgi:hypothetical protein
MDRKTVTPIDIVRLKKKIQKIELRLDEIVEFIKDFDYYGVFK